MADFFISYTGVDRAWAEWIGYVLEEASFSVIIQAWDFRPGSNFVIEMQKATAAERTVMVLSPDYLESVFALSEWAAAFAQDPRGMERKLLPVMVRNCKPPGLLAPLVHISIVDLADDVARRALLAGVNPGRAKPGSRPAYPGTTGPDLQQKPFPGSSGTVPGGRSATALPAYMPKPRRMPSDIDKRRFIKQSFETMKTLFEGGLQALERQHDGVETDFTINTATDFHAEIFSNGQSRCYCRIWLGGMFSENAINYSEMRGMRDSCNETLSLSDSRDELLLRALMSAGYTARERTLDMNRLTGDQAANYLWQRFAEHLER